MSIFLVDPGAVDYELIVTRIVFYANYGILEVRGHYINRLRTPKRVLFMLEKKRINRLGLYSDDILDIGRMNKIKNKPMVMFQWFKDIPSVEKFLKRCNVTITAEQKDIYVEDEDARREREIKWSGLDSSDSPVPTCNIGEKTGIKAT